MHRCDQTHEIWRVAVLDQHFDPGADRENVSKKHLQRHLCDVLGFIDRFGRCQRIEHTTFEMPLSLPVDKKEVCDGDVVDGGVPSFKRWG